LALQREFGVVLTEQQIARVVTIRDLLREVVAATPPGAELVDIAEQEKLWLEPYGLQVRVLRVFGEGFVWIAMRCFFRLRVEGLGKLPEPPFLLCPNHASYLDGFALAAALPHRQLRSTYWAGWTGVLFSSRHRRLFSRAAQIIPIDPDRAATAGVALGAAVLARGRILVWFPEGALSSDGSLQTFQPGVGAVLERYSASVVPVYIAGTAAALPPGHVFPRPRRITVRFGDAFDPARAVPGVAGRPRERLIADAVRAAVAALVSKTG
jgi:long-chain acyl-CoA synthetase